MKVQTIYEWDIVNDGQFQYIEGYREDSENLYETSNIVFKIPLKHSLLIITENESLYCLPYNHHASH